MEAAIITFLTTYHFYMKRCSFTSAAGSSSESLEDRFLHDFKGTVESLCKILSNDSKGQHGKPDELARNILLSQLVLLFDSNPPSFVRRFLQNLQSNIQLDEKKLRPILSPFFLRYTYSCKEHLYSDATSQVDPSFLGRIYERYFTGEDRERMGVYYTSKVEIEFMCKISLLKFLKTRTRVLPAKLVVLIYDPLLRKFDENDSPDHCPLDKSEALEVLIALNSVKILDPCCGSGAFLLGMFHEVCHLQYILSKSFPGIQTNSTSNILQNFQGLYGMDVNPHALWIAKIRLWLALLDRGNFKSANDTENIEQILDSHLLLGDCLISTAPLLHVGFDIVIGNPPYIQHTRIAPPSHKSPTKGQKLAYLQQIQDILRRTLGESIPFQGQADYYVYFFLRGVTFLREGGFLCYITSSTWLDGELGLDLRAFLVKKTLITQCIDTLVHKSFTQANINTVITILQQIPRDKSPLDNSVQFCLFKIPLAGAINPSIILLLEELRETKDLEWGQITVVPQGILRMSIKGGERDRFYQLQNRWGMNFLKYYGPIIQILNEPNIRQKFVSLADLANLKRGFTSGANKFFYLNQQQVKRTKIEQRFLLPLIKSPKELKKICLDLNFNAKFYVFSCREPKQALQGTNALKYIESYGEQVKIKIKGRTVVGFHNTETCLARHPWYALPPHEPAPLIIQKGFSETFAIFQNTCKILVDQTFYEIFPKNNVSVESLLAALNSTLTIFELLRISSSGLGGGLYRPTVNELRTLPLPDIRYLPPLLIPASLKQRKIGTIFEECGLNPHIEVATQKPAPQPDRLQLDEMIFDLLGINRQWLPELYRVVCRLVQDRLLKAAKL